SRHRELRLLKDVTSDNECCVVGTPTRSPSRRFLGCTQGESMQDSSEIEIVAGIHAVAGASYSTKIRRARSSLSDMEETRCSRNFISALTSACTSSCSEVCTATVMRWQATDSGSSSSPNDRVSS